MAKRSTKSGSSKPTPRPVTPRRQTAIDAYTKEHGRAPPRSMTITAMNAKVERANRSRQYQADKMRVVNEMDKGLGANPKPLAPAISQEKLADVRLETAKAQAQVAVSTRSKRWADAARHNLSEADRRLTAAGAPTNAEMVRNLDASAMRVKRIETPHTNDSHYGITTGSDAAKPKTPFETNQARAAERWNGSGTAARPPRDTSLSETVPRTKGLDPNIRKEALTRHAREKATWGMSSPERSLAQSQENRLTMGAGRPATDPKSVFHQIATVPQKPSAPARKLSLHSGQTVNRALMGAGIAVAAGRGFQDAKAEGKSTGEAVVAGAKSAAVPAAIAAAPVIAKGAGHLATGAFAVAGAAAEGIGVFDHVFMGAIHAKIAGVAGLTGVAAKGVEIAAKGVSRVALPAMAAYSAYQGAKEAGAKGENMTVGAGRGLVRAFDPSAIFMKRGVGERVFDAGVNAVSSRMSSGQQAKFAQANAHYSSSHMGADAGNDGYQVGAGKRGFGNPNNQAAAQKAKGNKYEGPAG